MDSALFLTEREVARRFSLTLSWLRAARSRGGGPRFAKLGRKVLYRLDDVEKYLAERVVASTSEVAKNG